MVVRLSFALIGEFSPVYIHGWLYDQFSESQAAFGTTFRVTGGFLKAAPEEGYKIVTFSIQFPRSIQILYFGFSSQKDSKNCVNIKCLLKKDCFDFKDL
jgi:hypothetical protein